jgi:hypothetical protein
MTSHTSRTTTVSAAVVSAILGGTTPALGEELAKQNSLQPVKLEVPPLPHVAFGGIPVSPTATPSTSPVVPIDPWAVLQTLEAGWDGANAAPISADAIAHAKSFLNYITYLAIDFTPFADPDGSVGMEADKGDKNILLLVDEQGLLTYVISEGAEVHRGDNVTPRKMRNLLAHLS